LFPKNLFEIASIAKKTPLTDTYLEVFNQSTSPPFKTRIIVNIVTIKPITIRLTKSNVSFISSYLKPDSISLIKRLMIKINRTSHKKINTKAIDTVIRSFIQYIYLKVNKNKNTIVNVYFC
jgi:hypothetical protein